MPSMLHEGLTERLEASLADRQLDAMIAVAVYGGTVSEKVGQFWKGHEDYHPSNALFYTSKIDDAIAILPDTWLIESMGEYPNPDDAKKPFFCKLRPRKFGDSRRVIILDCVSLPMAICIAALKARAMEIDPVKEM